MKTNKVVIASLSMLITSTAALAGTMGPVADTWSRVMTLSGGPAWSTSGNSQTFFLQPDIEKTYAATRDIRAIAMGEFFVGLQHSVSPNFLGQVGIAVAATSSTRLQGDIWDDADPNLNNFYYSYKIRHTHLALKGKLLADAGQWIQPYITGSLGAGFNRASDFSMTPKIFEAIPTPAFRDNTTMAFTYTLGIGLQKSLNDNWQFGVGYEFADWGKSKLSRAPGQTVNSGLHLNHLYTNELQFSLSYVV